MTVFMIDTRRGYGKSVSVGMVASLRARMSLWLQFGDQNTLLRPGYTEVHKAMFTVDHVVKPVTEHSEAIYFYGSIDSPSQGVPTPCVVRAYPGYGIAIIRVELPQES